MSSPNNDFRQALLIELETGWAATARASQLPPAGPWSVWLLMAGRGFGKTRTGAEWVLDQVSNGCSRIALVGPTAADTRDVMIEGESGILACSPSYNRPTYEPSKRRVTWPTGAIATAFSADEPERLRGPQHDAAWCDELAAWRYPAAWDMLMFGLRLGKNPRCVVTTTPRPVKIIRDLLTRPDCVVTRGSSFENKENLAPQFFSAIVRKYQGTRLGRQELEAELLDDVPGALWNRDVIDTLRRDTAPASGFRRLIVGLDPSGSDNPEADEVGIILCGLDEADHGWVIADASGKYSPTEWAKIAVGLYHKYHADRIVAEINYGGAMVESVIRAVDPNVSYMSVTASRGKVARAEPISALYEQNRVHHLGIFPQLEDEMAGFTSDFDRATAGYSPNRVDALVWALSELMTQPMKGYAIYQLYRRQAAGLLSHDPKPSELTYQQSRNDAIRAERERYAAIVAGRMPTPEEAHAHTARIDEIIRRGQ
jgi:phage terminase large subunit-like protein